MISGRLEESEVGVGGLHLDIFECLLQLVSNLNTVLYQASIIMSKQSTVDQIC